MPDCGHCSAGDTKEDEKIEKYRDLCRELERLWRVKCRVVPVIVGALGTIPTRLSHTSRCLTSTSQ